MLRYKVMRRMGFDPLASSLVSVLNWVFAAPPNEIRVLHVVIEFDPKDFT